jgi:hypothetical protein
MNKLLKYVLAVLIMDAAAMMLGTAIVRAADDVKIHSTWTKVTDNIFIDTNRDNITHKDGYTLSYVYMKFNPPLHYHTEDNQLSLIGAIYYQFRVNCDTGEAGGRRMAAVDMTTGDIHSMGNSDEWMNINQKPATDALIAFTNFVCAKAL